MKKLTTKPGHPVEKGWLQVTTSDGYKFIKPEGGSEWTDGDITITDEELLEFMRDGCHDPRSLRPTAPPPTTKTETHFHKRKDNGQSLRITHDRNGTLSYDDELNDMEEK